MISSFFQMNPILKARVYAFTLDLLVINVLNFFLISQFTRFLQHFFFHFPLSFQIQMITQFKFYQSISLLSLSFAYFCLFNYATDGRTLGKAIFQIKISSLNYQSMTLSKAIWRSFIYQTMIVTGSILFIVAFFRKDQRGIQDILSSSYVHFENETTQIASSAQGELEATYEQQAA